MQLTEEQQAIIAAVPTIKDCMKINAFAGTGKTSTLVAIAKAYPHETFYYLAFNKAIADESRKKFPNNVVVKTTHSFAYPYIVSHGEKIRGDYKPIEIAQILHIDYTSAIQIHGLLNYFMNGAFTTIKDAGLALGLEQTAPQIKFAQTFYLKMKERTLTITHSYYLKEFQLNLPVEKIKTGYFLVDEAQDTNDVTLNIISRLRGKKIIVGDTHQQIYAFRGSVDAMQKVLADKVYYLTETFRCRPNIVAEANYILHQYKNENHLLKAAYSDMQKIETVGYLSRTNAALINLVDSLDNFKLTRSAEEIFKSSLSVHFMLTGEFHRIYPEYKFLIKVPNKEELLKYIDESEDVELRCAYANHLNYGDRLNELLDKAIRCSLKNDSNITISTAHSSKGLEWDKVTLMDDFADLDALYQKAASQHKMTLDIINEFNLRYVAVTRARYILNNMMDGQ